MDDYATATTHFATRTGLALEATFDGGRLTSDGGLPWLAAIDREVGGCEVIAAHVPEWRGKRVQPSLLELVRQRVYQIACGDEDHNDADTLRSDPLLKRVCGRRPERGADLAAQPTRSRLEHAVAARACDRMTHALGALSSTQRAKHGVPQRIVLDSDSTDDPTHGDQEGSAYHGSYEQPRYHPLLVFDGDSGQLISVVLRPGTTHANRGAVAILKRIVQRLRAAWPHGGIEVRADAGVASPAGYEMVRPRGSRTRWG